MSVSMKRILTSLALLVAVSGCKIGHGKANNESFRPTLQYFLTTTALDSSSAALPILDSRDLDSFETQSGATQSGGKGMVYAVIRDAAGAPQSGATLEAVNDAGLATGSIYYRTPAGFNGGLGTDSSGALVIFNLDPGRINL